MTWEQLESLECDYFNDNFRPLDLIDEIEDDEDKYFLREYNTQQQQKKLDCLLNIILLF